MHKYWDYEKLAAEASKYSTKTVFANANKYAYSLAKKKGILDKICSHMPKRKRKEEKLTVEFIGNEALKYKTRGEFKISSPSSYSKASKLNILDKICSHMPKDSKIGSKPHNFKWDKKSVHRICKLFTTKKEFRENYEGAYLAAQTNRWLEEVSSHMKKSPNTSGPEKELFNVIKKLYQSTKKLKDYKINIPEKPYMHRFEIDIYVPELKKGIEFNGTYWHSFNVMRKDKRKKDWTDEDIKNYKIIKENYFYKKYKIKILHIEEYDWKENKELCIQKCINFIKNEF